MRFTLVSPRIAIQKGDFLGSGIPYWPADLAVLAAFLRERGESVSVIDLLGDGPGDLEERTDHYLQGRPFERYLATPRVGEADIFILYAMSSMSHQELLAIARGIRCARSEATLAVLENSQAVTAYSLPRVASDFFAAGIDALLCGEVYWNWPEVAAFLADLRRAPTPENVLVAHPPPGHALNRKTNRRPTYPVPAWDLFNLEGYWSLPYSHGPKTRRFLPLLTSRGCPYPCDFCVVPETNNRLWRGRPPAEVVDEMIKLRDRLSVRDFQIEDLNPTVSGPRFVEICRLLTERRAGVTFSFVSGTKAETIRIEEVPLYAAAGCRYISISPESGSPAVLKAIGKPFDHAHALELVAACREHGIYTQACFIVGHPNEREEDHRQSCAYLRSLLRAGLDEVAVFIVAPLPGSQIHAKAQIELSSPGTLVSFSPKGRAGWADLARRRRELVRIFFVEKLKAGPRLWLQLLRSLFGTPRTKMENLPRRMMYVYASLARHHLSRWLPMRRLEQARSKGAL